MKAVTVHVDESTYRDFQQQAKSQRRTAAELIREAMEAYRRHLHPKGRPLDAASGPASVGAVLRPWSGRADLLDDFFA